MPKTDVDQLFEHSHRNKSNHRLLQILEQMQMTTDPEERKRLEDAAVKEFYSDAA